MAKKTRARLSMPNPKDLPELIDDFPYSLDQVAILTNCGSKSTVYRYIREGIWPKPIKVGAKPALLGKTVRAIRSGELALAA